MDERVLAVLRNQAWEKAKGELQAALVTFYDNPEGFDKADSVVKRFVKKVEDDGLFA